mmetsp:Transcript_22499/g.27129  ORF Transcript_22499/g.27129 Transcript_22499/m.27129 type:complete len:238 (+) Transcript_22499:102-815(+)
MRNTLLHSAMVAWMSMLFPILSANAFSVVPCPLVGLPVARMAVTTTPQNQKEGLMTTKLSNDDDNNGNDENFLTIATTQSVGENDEIQQALLKHDMLRMLGLQLKFVEVPCVGDDESLDSNLLQDIDLVCFQTEEAVKQWLQQIDKMLGIEDSESLEGPEKLALGNGDVVAACMYTEVANVCLQSSRWESRNIYYPNINKAGMRATDSDKNDLEKWADSTAQAFGDIMERKFWGGGW